MLTKSSTLKPLAVVVFAASVSACATTTPDGNPQYPLDRVTTVIGDASSAIGEAGSRVWEGTKHLFKLKQRSNSTSTPNDEFADEVDLALLEEGDYTPPNPDDFAVGSVEVFEVGDDKIILDTFDTDAAQLAQAPAAIDETLPTMLPSPAKLEIPTPGMTVETPTVAAVDEAPAVDASLLVHAEKQDGDFYHTVGQNENLWDLSKELTGNATNWKQIAEINNLDENGNIFYGKKLRIPAGMLRESPVTRTDTKMAAAKPALPANTDGVAVTVEAGESLWNMAKRTTGNANNWWAIAEFNGMDEQQANKIRYGQKLNIPANLLIEGGDAPVTLAAAKAVAKVIEPTNKPEHTLAMEQTKRLNEKQDAQGKLVTVPANFTSDPPRIEIPKAQAAQKLAADSKAKSGEIMVSGTYYPKAIYNDANFSASLLMRVSPGTRLKISRALGPWYEVVTDRGLGYVHSRDTK